ncbi:MAG: hypothetical protein P1T08_12770 [Acidimicrobiia bacterium]|nr:hypothetical protein [Acidimicrobiia bacterium]
MTQTNAEIVIGANGAAYVAPVGTALPTYISDALNVAFVELGFLTEDGLKFKDEPSQAMIKSWQSLYPTRRTIEGYEASVAFTMQQWNKGNVEFALNGVVTEPDPVGHVGEYTFTPTRDGVVPEKSLIVEWQDGTKNYRLLIARGTHSEAVETELVKGSEAGLPIGFEIIESAGISPYLLLTDDPAFA